MSAVPNQAAALPPPELAGYVIGGEGDPERALELYVAVGAELRDGILRLLGDGWSFRGRRVLDFGCGSGRVLRQFLTEAGDAEFHGCDIDAACIAWLQEHLSPPINVRRSGPLPPLLYPDGSFDLVLATAVLSHLPDAWAEWVLDLHRILAPEGLLVATVMGKASSEPIAHESWDPDRIGMTVLGYGRSWQAGGPMTLHSEWWVRAHWGRAFDVLAYEEGAVCGQDAILMRRKDVALTPENLQAPEPDEPREVRALEHAVELLHKEYAEINAAHDAYADAYHAETERRLEAEGRLAELQAQSRTPLIGRLVRLARGRVGRLSSR